MPGDEKILSDADRARLDGIVNKMIENNEKDEDIQFVVNDFKDKYGLKKKESTTSPLASTSTDLSTSAPSVSEGGTSGLASTPSVSTGPTMTMKDGKPFLNLNQQVTPVDQTLKAATTQADITPKSNVYAPLEKVQIKNEDQGTGIGTAVARGTARMVNSVLKSPKFVYDISVAQQNPIVKATLDKLNMGSAEQLAGKLGIWDPTKEIDAAIQANEQEMAQKYDQSINDYFFGEKPDVKKGLSLLANRVAEALPTTMALMMTGAMSSAEGIAGSTIAFGAEKKSQLDANNPDMSEDDKTANALISGALETVTEYLPTNALVGLAERALMKTGVESAKKVAKEGFKAVVGKALKEYGGAFMSDAVGEMANQFGENVTDKLTGADPNKNPWDGVMDAMWISLGSTGAMTAPIAAIDVVKTASGLKKATELEKNKESLTQDLQSPEVSPETKSIISEKIKNINDEEATLAQQEKERYAALPQEGKTEVDRLLGEIKKVTDVLSDPAVSDDTRKALQKEVDDFNKQIEDVYDLSEQGIEKEDFMAEFQKSLAEEQPGTKTEPATIQKDQAVTTDEQAQQSAEQKKPEAKEVELPGVDVGGVKGLPRKMVFDESDQKWKQSVGGELTNVSDQAQQEAQGIYEEALNKKREELQRSDVISSSINVAPLFSQKIKNMDEANQLHATRFYKKYKQDVRDVAKEFNVTIDAEEDGIGGFADLSEATTVFKVTGDFNDIVKLAAAVGGLTPEVQESTIASMYVQDGDKNHNADQTEVGIDNPEAAIKAARDAGFESTGYTLVGNKINFLEIFDYPDANFKEKIITFINKYNEYGGRIESTEKRAVRSEYIDHVRRGEILSEIEKSSLQQRQGGSRLRDISRKAKQRTDSYRKWKEIDSTKEAKRYRELRKKQIDLSAEGKKLSKEEKAEISKLEKFLAEPLASIIASDKELYEEAKKDIDAITNQVSSIVDDGFSLKPEIKRPSRAAEKVIRWYDIQPNLLNDGARATIIVNNDSDADFVFNRMTEMYSVPGMRAPVNEKTFLGFRKRLLEIRAENGKIVEVQVTTPAVYLAKEGLSHFLPENRKAAEDALKEVRKKVGFDIPEGGGHFFYEISRDENVQDELRDKANDLSKKYYDLFFSETFSMSKEDFTKELSDFVKAVDSADKSEWDPSNKGNVPTPIREFINQKPKTNATKKGNITEGDQQQHQKRDESGETAKTSDRDRNVESGKKQEEEVTKEEPVSKKKEAPSKELVDEEEEADKELKEDQETIDKMDKDLAAAKAINKNDKDAVKKAEDKFKGAIYRAFIAKDQKKIKKTTYTAFRNAMQQIIGPKLNANAEESKARLEQLKEVIKQRLLGEGYKKILLSAPGFGPAQVAALIDFTIEAAKKAIDAGYSIKDAAERAIAFAKGQPIYAKLVEKKHLDEKEFESAVRDTFNPKEEKKEEKKKEEPKVEKKEETKERKTSQRVMESNFVDPGIKDALAEEGFKYVPRGINMAQSDARKIVKHFLENDKIDDLIETVTTNSEMSRVEKNSMAATIFEALNKEIGKTSDEDTKNELRKKAVKMHQFLAKNLTESAQDLRLNGTINKSIAEGDPDVAITLLKEQAQKNIEKNLGTKEQDKKINDTVNSLNNIEEEVSRRVKENLTEEVEKEIEKRILKVVPKETIDKLNKFFDGLLIKPGGKLFADVTGLGGLTVLVWNGAVSTVKGAVYLGLTAYNGVANSQMINNAVQAGVDYIKENHKGEFDEKNFRDKVTEEITKGLKDNGIEIRERKERKKDLEKMVDDVVNEMKEGKKPKPQSEKKTEKNADVEKVKAVMEQAIGKLEMSDYAKKKLTVDVIDHLENNDGKISKKKFKELYAEALGYDFVTPEIEADIKANFEEIKKATDLQDKINDKLDEAVSAENSYKAKGQKMPSEERSKFIKEINALRKEHNTQTLKAQKANDKISGHFREGKNFYRMLGAVLQGNLLTPMSQVFNITGYLYTLPVRFVGGLAGTALDLVESGLARTKLFGDRLDKNLQTNIFAETAYGLKYGVAPGVQEALFKLKTGQLSEDTALRDVSQKFNAFDSFYDFFSGKLKGKDFETKVTSLFEGTFGLPAEIMFRLLGPADIMVRKGKEYGRLAELAKAQGLEGFEFMREILNPATELKEQAQQESLRASYQNENVPTKTIKFMEKGMEDWINKIAGEKLGYHLNGMLSLAKTAVIPFTKTPINVVSELLQYSFPPISFAKALVAAKHGDRRAFNVSMGKAMVGAGLSYIAYQLIMNGLMTGAPDDEDKDKEKRAMYEGIGYKKMNYSALQRFIAGDPNWNKIKDNDNWVNYEKMGLPGMVMATWAAYYKDRTPEEMRDQNLAGDMFAGIQATLKASLEQSFLKGTSDALTSLMNPSGKKAQYFYVNYLGSMASIVYPNTLASISRSSDPLVRDKRTDEGFTKMLVNDFKVKMFMGDQLPSRVTLWGEDAKKVPEGTNPYVYYLLDPIKSNSVSTKTFGYKIFDFWRNVSESNKDLKNKILPSIPQKSLRMNGQDIPLTDSEYNTFQKLVGKSRAQGAEAYVLYGDFDTDDPQTKAETLQRIYSSSYSLAKDEMINNTPRLQEIMMAD
jgi:hypothetical protein